jgi:hypothetical protein
LLKKARTKAHYGENGREKESSGRKYCPFQFDREVFDDNM